MAKRKIPCPYCSGEVLSEQNGRTTSSASLFPKVQNILVSLSDLFSSITGNTKTVSRKEATGGKCEACNNTGYIIDASDTTDAAKAAAEVLKSNEDRIEKNLAKLGNSPGGSRLTRIAGADVLIIGHELNTAESVAVVQNVAGPGGPTVGKSKSGEGKGGLPGGIKGYNHVQGLNPPANSGGGHYVIQCGNKFNLIAGAQGASIDTYGQLNLHGKAGVQITGAEVTVGTSIGQTAIGGNHINIQGDNISVSPSGKTGHVTVNGSVQATGNVQSGGAYFDNVYFAKATCPVKQVSTTASAAGIKTGPPSWGGVNSSALRAATIDLQKFILERTADFNLFKAAGPVTPRFYFDLVDRMFNLTYSMIPIEPKITGIILPGTCYVVGSLGAATNPFPIPIFNFPHTHSLHDSVHTHDVKVPAIDYEKHTSASSVRTAFEAAGGNTGIPAAGSTGDNSFGAIAKAAGAAVNAIGALTSKGASHPSMYA